LVLIEWGEALTTPEGTVEGDYDEQDRLLGYDDWGYTYTDNGELLTKVDTITGDTTTYSYDADDPARRAQANPSNWRARGAALNHPDRVTRPVRVARLARESAAVAPSYLWR